LSCSKDEELG